MILIDTNLIIYSQNANYAALSELLRTQKFGVSSITKLETLGYHKITKESKRWFTDFFASIPVFPATDKVIDKAILLKQQKKMSVADSIIAATALCENVEFWTNDLQDFTHIAELKLHNPLTDTQITC